MKRMLLIAFLNCVLCNITQVCAKVKLPSLLGSNMVLQQNTEVQLWGMARPNVKLIVKASWLDSAMNIWTDEKGKWWLKVHTPKAGGPYELVFDDGEKLVLKNIYMGEVWLCSGQSNMEMPVKGLNSQPVLHSNETIAEADEEVPIRLFSVKHVGAKDPMDDVEGVWTAQAPEQVAEFSAAAYFFGKQLYRTLKVPVGLIHSSWGASTIEAWMSEECLKMYPSISTEHLHRNIKMDALTQEIPCFLYNAMLYPLRRLKIAGTIWYQGEANRERPSEYMQLFPDFVKMVRNLFDAPEMPFYYAQIAPFSYADDAVKDNGAQLREVQRLCERKISNSGMAVLMDIGENYMIHPCHKIEVGQRLAYLALSKHYDVRGITAESPRYAKKEIKDDWVELWFDHAENGLTSFGKDLKCFEVAGADSVFYPAEAYARNNKVLVHSNKVKQPVAVRYAWKNYIVGDLFNTAGLPVSSFRTDF